MFSMWGENFKPESMPDSVDIVLTSDAFSTMNLHDDTNGIGFYHNEQLYMVEITPMMIAGLKSGQTVKTRAYRVVRNGT